MEGAKQKTEGILSSLYGFRADPDNIKARCTESAICFLSLVPISTENVIGR